MTMSQSSRFWDNMAERYSRQPIADEAAYQKKLQVTREYLEPNMTVLEFGCGTGSTAINHASHVRSIHAIDISSKMIEIAQDKADAAQIENINFERSTIDDLTVPDQSLDAVLALSILHLLDNREEAIAKVYRMLKPGGVFVSSTVCIGEISKLFKIVAPIGKLLGLTLKVFTSRELEDSLTDAGFQIDYQWRPGDGKSVFIAAKKPELAGSTRAIVDR
jgi:ubiquinone/menaquinone biosynthesis C-methylase UbiE